jgi:hypothetical protein
MNEDPTIPFYGRYIDDVLALVYATSESKAKSLLENRIKFKDCVITWSSSSQYMVFLDMTLYFDSAKVLQHKPFRKPMNHFERIPWISAHPLYVKKGTFVSELSRIATLCSQFDDFADACKQIADIYIARGYPPMLIAAWLKLNYRARWDARLREFSPPRADVLVLKSDYNISWDLFDVHVLEERIKTGWRTAMRTLAMNKLPSDNPLWYYQTRSRYTMINSVRAAGTPGTSLTRQDGWVEEGFVGSYLRLDKLGLLEKRFIVSKKRNRQLMDLCAMWRKSVLVRVDRQVVSAKRKHQTRLDDWLVDRKIDPNVWLQ